MIGLNTYYPDSHKNMFYIMKFKCSHVKNSYFVTCESTTFITGRKRNLFGKLINAYITWNIAAA